ALIGALTVEANLTRGANAVALTAMIRVAACIDAEAPALHGAGFAFHAALAVFARRAACRIHGAAIAAFATVFDVRAQIEAALFAGFSRRATNEATTPVAAHSDGMWRGRASCAATIAVVLVLLSIDALSRAHGFTFVTADDDLVVVVATDAHANVVGFVAL